MKYYTRCDWSQESCSREIKKRRIATNTTQRVANQTMTLHKAEILGVQGRREQQALVGGEQRAALPESARDEERAANIGTKSKQRAVLTESARAEERAANGRRSKLHCQRVQGMRWERPTLVGGMNRELHCQRVQGLRRKQPIATIMMKQFSLCIIKEGCLPPCCIHKLTKNGLLQNGKLFIC